MCSAHFLAASGIVIVFDVKAVLCVFQVLGLDPGTATRIEPGGNTVQGAVAVEYNFVDRFIVRIPVQPLVVSQIISILTGNDPVMLPTVAVQYKRPVQFPAQVVRLFPDAAVSVVLDKWPVNIVVDIAQFFPEFACFVIVGPVS